MRITTLKDIEENLLKMPLIDFFKTIGHKIYTRDGHECYVDFNNIEQDSCGYYCFNTVYGNYYLSDYKFTWALNKEDLKHD